MIIIVYLYRAKKRAKTYRERKKLLNASAGRRAG